MRFPREDLGGRHSNRYRPSAKAPKGALIRALVLEVPPPSKAALNHPFTNEAHSVRWLRKFPRGFCPMRFHRTYSPDCGITFRLRTAVVRRLILLVTLLCALGATQTSAQNEISQQLLEMDEEDRNITFTLLLRGNDQKCDQVIRTLFKGAFLEMDEWEALCRDRHSYSFVVPANPEATITSLSCRDLLQTSRMLLQRAGRRSKARGCRIK